MKVKKIKSTNWLLFNSKIVNKNLPTKPDRGGIPAKDNNPSIIDIKKNE